MADYLDNVAAEDVYADALSLGPDFATDTATVTIANNPVLMQFAIGKVGDWRWTEEREYFSIPQSFRIGNIVGIRFRNATPGAVAQVLCTLFGPADPIFEAGTPFTQTLSPEGQISSSVLAPSLALASFPPVNPSDGQVVDLVLPASFDPIGGKSIRWLCRYDGANAVWHVAGAPLEAEVAAQEQAPGNVYGDLATVGPALALPRPGDYYIEVNAQINSVTGANVEGFMAYSGAGLAAADGDAAIGSSPTGSRVSASEQKLKTGLTAGIITAKYRAGSSNDAQFGARRLTVTPVRIT